MTCIASEFSLPSSFPASYSSLTWTPPSFTSTCYIPSSVSTSMVPGSAIYAGSSSPSCTLTCRITHLRASWLYHLRLHHSQLLHPPSLCPISSPFALSPFWSPSPATLPSPYPHYRHRHLHHPHLPSHVSICHVPIPVTKPQLYHEFECSALTPSVVSCSSFTTSLSPMPAPSPSLPSAPPTLAPAGP
ncbi:hypothetical protein WJX77_011698 [Trebouxia sp. C0004]